MNKATQMGAIGLVLVMLGGAGCRSTMSELEKPVPVAPFVEQERNNQKKDTAIETRVFFAAGQGEQIHLASRPREANCNTSQIGLVSHHVLAISLLQEAFATWKACRPATKRVVIISPDHFRQLDPAAVGTSHLDYLFRGDRIEVDQNAVAELEKNAFVASSMPFFAREHGIGVIAPFVHLAWPQAKIVPITINRFIERDQALILQKQLATWLQDPDTLVLLSSDLSHYLPKRQAQVQQKAVMQALSANDRAFFWRANDDQTDLGKGFWIVMGIVPQGSWSLWQEAISTDFGESANDTTTYAIGSWQQEKEKPLK